MVDHTLIVKRQNKEKWIQEEIVIPIYLYEVIKTQSEALGLSLDEYVNVALREYIFELVYKTKNVIFDTDGQLLTEDEFSELFNDLPLYIHSKDGGGVIIPPEQYEMLQRSLDDSN